jgi:ureidoacrylate peracid hydrolase
MHHITAGQHVIDRVMVRRGRYHWFEILDPKRSALVVIDMQNTFCEPGSPSEVQGSREIVPSINVLSARLCDRGEPIIWVLHANTHAHGRSDWELFFNDVVADEVRQRTIDSLAPGRQAVWKDLHTHSADITLIKNRYSALVPGSSTLERVLRNLNIDTLMIAGTKTHICCEATARDAMMLDFKVGGQAFGLLCRSV